MQIAKKAILFTLATTILVGCTEPGGRPGRGVMQGGSVNKQDVGMLAGAIGGGVLGNQIGGGAGKTVATIAGTLLGGAIGSSIGSSLDRADMAYYDQTSQRAMETGQPGQAFPWSNPKSGNSGTIVPSNPYQASNGQYCREYTQTIKVGGKSQKGYGTACRQPDGSWQIQE